MTLSSAPPAPPAPEAARGKILVVDDDDANLVALQSLLSEAGYPVVCANSGEEGLRRVLLDEFAVILLDVRMPGMNGYEAAELIRSRARSRHVPIIFLSGVDKDSSHLFRGYAAGAVDFVFKPVEPMILLSKIAVFSDLHEKAHEIKRQGDEEKRLLAENLHVKAQQAEVAQALQRSLAQQSLVIDTLPIALYVAAGGDDYESRRIVGGNVDRLLQPDGGASRALPEQWSERLHPDDRSRFRAAMQQVRTSGSVEVQYRFDCGGGNYRWLAERSDLRPGQDGGEPELFGLITDITERRRLEAQLTHAQKMEAIGQMSGQVAHDFNNMLSVIIGGVDRTLAKADLDERSRRQLSLVLQAARSCADLTKRLLGLARRQNLEPRALLVGEEVIRLNGLFGRMLGENIETRIECGDDLWPTFLDQSQFEGALVNLVVNARDAMPDGGTLTIAAHNLTLGEYGAAPLGLPPGDYVHLRVVDTGLGMDDATQARALEPFFTTKSQGKGTGLGLSTIYGFLRDSGGGLRIESAPGRGTTIHLYLPRSLEEALAPAPGRRGADPKIPAGLRVLVVEDNDSVREIAVSMLESFGCSVMSAPNGDVAFAQRESYGGLSALFTDCHMMGRLDGPGLARALAELQPGLPVIFTSGYQTSVAEITGSRTAFLPKPYTQIQLAMMLERVLDLQAAAPEGHRRDLAHISQS